MISRSIKHLLSVSLAGLGLAAASIASGETTVKSIQTLDRVDVYNKTKVLEMEFDDPGRTFDFTALDVTPASTAGFSACQVTATQALYCVDGKEVVYWPKPAEVAPPNSTNGQPLFSCSDSVLGLDPIASRPCTAMTVDLSGAIWVAGKLPASSSHSLFKLVPKQGTSCPSNWNPLTAPSQYCARLYATYPRPIAEISAVDGDVGALFRAGPGAVQGPGVLALATDPPDPSGIAYRRTVVFFKDDATALPVTPVVIASGSTYWGSTQLQSVTLLQRTAEPVTKNFILATSTQGKILAVDAVGDAPAFEVFDIVSERANSPSFPQSQCNTSAQQYGLRASSKSGRVYLTDRNYCQAVALETAPSADTPFKLQNVQEEPGVDLTFSTTAAYPPDAATIAPGTAVNLFVCNPECVLLSDENGAPAAKLFGVKLASGSKSGMTLFQVKDIPDCRWAPALCEGLVDVVIREDGVSVGLGTQPANKLFLNVTPLLPLEIRALFDGTGIPPEGLPRLLISPQYRGQAKRDFKFEALVGLTEDGVVFIDTFSGEFDVEKLVGQDQNLGCGYDYSEAKKPNREWDVVTTVSERVVTAGGPGAVTDSNSINKNLHVDTLTNVGCYNPTQISGSRWSMYAYNLEIAPDTDAVFAKLLIKLYDDLKETHDQLACRAPTVDTGSSTAQLSRAVCSNLRKLWSAGKTKLDKCYAASTAPKSSAGAENCQAFFTQLKQYETTLNGATTVGPDPANRLGELKARVKVIGHVYQDRFLPSIPANGFKNQ